jgi:hypothetical protein
MQLGLQGRGVTRSQSPAAGGDGINSNANSMTYAIPTIVLKDDCHA